jgi:hypothetical protein
MNKGAIPAEVVPYGHGMNPRILTPEFHPFLRISAYPRHRLFSLRKRSNEPMNRKTKKAPLYQGPF